jgi:hypothetical protein
VLRDADPDDMRSLEALMQGAGANMATLYLVLAVRCSDASSDGLCQCLLSSRRQLPTNVVRGRLHAMLPAIASNVTVNVQVMVHVHEKVLRCGVAPAVFGLVHPEHVIPFEPPVARTCHTGVVKGLCGFESYVAGHKQTKIQIDGFPDVVVDLVRALYATQKRDPPSVCASKERINADSQALANAMLNNTTNIIRVTSAKQARQLLEVVSTTCTLLGLSERIRTVAFELPKTEGELWKPQSLATMKQPNRVHAEIKHPQGLEADVSLAILAGKQVPLQSRGDFHIEQRHLPPNLRFVDLRALDSSRRDISKYLDHELRLVSGYLTGTGIPTVLGICGCLQSTSEECAPYMHGDKAFHRGHFLLTGATHAGLGSVCDALVSTIRSEVKTEQFEVDIVDGDCSAEEDENEGAADASAGVHIEPNMGRYPDPSLVASKPFQKGSQKEGQYGVRQGDGRISNVDPVSHRQAPKGRNRLTAKVLVSSKYALRPWHRSPRDDYTQPEPEPAIAAYYTLVDPTDDVDKTFKFVIPQSQKQHFDFVADKQGNLVVKIIKPALASQDLETNRLLKHAIFQFSYSRSGGLAPIRADSGPQGCGNLDMRFAMGYDQDKRLMTTQYCQIVVVQDQEREQYIADWPRLVICSLPEDANSKPDNKRGIGTARDYTKLLASKLIQPDTEGIDSARFCFFIDDSTLVLRYNVLRNDPINSQEIAGKFIEPLADRSQAVDVSAFTILNHVGEDPDRFKYAAVGFLKDNPLYHRALFKAYSRNDIGCWTFVNLDMTQGIGYNREQSIYEDFDWNSRVSDSGSLTNPMLIVKYRRFALQKMPRMAGGVHEAIKQSKARNENQTVCTRRRRMRYIPPLPQHTTPPQEKTPTLQGKFRGLLNRAGKNACALNSLVQLLWSMRVYSRDGTLKELPLCMADSQAPAGTAAFELVQLFQKMRADEPATVERLQNCLVEPSRMGQQEDPGDLLLLLQQKLSGSPVEFAFNGALRGKTWELRVDRRTGEWKPMPQADGDFWHIPISPLSDDSALTALRTFTSWEPMAADSRDVAYKRRLLRSGTLPQHLLFLSEADSQRKPFPIRLDETLAVGDVVAQSSDQEAVNREYITIYVAVLR